MNLLQAMQKAEETRQSGEAAHDMPDALPFPALDFPPLQQAPAEPAESRIEPAPPPRMEKLAEQKLQFAPPPAGSATPEPVPTMTSASLAETGTHPPNVHPLLSAPRAKSPRSRTAWLLGGGILLGGMGAGLWWQGQPVAAPAAVLPMARAADKSTAPAAPPEEEEAPAPASMPSALTPAPLHPTASLPLKLPQIARPPASDKAAYIEALPIPANLPRIERNRVEAGIPAPLEIAWHAWQRGDYASAEIHYRRMLASDPRNRDALLGLAALAARQGQKLQAAQEYQRLLALNPQDEEALAGLLLIHPEALSESAEAQLLQHADPGRSPQVLGQYYAARNRWHEAQEQYFRAFVRNPDNADLAFNLAVSLDYMGQKKPAADYYRRALTLESGSFDRTAAALRLATLLAEQP